VIGGNTNGHVDSEWKGYERIHGGYGLEYIGGDEAEERVLNFALSYDLAVINTYFRKTEEHIRVGVIDRRLIIFCERERG